MARQSETMAHGSITIRLLLVAVLALAAAPAWSDGDHDRARRAVERGEALPLREVLARLGDGLGGRVVEIEFEREHGRWVYELKVIDAEGRLREIYVDARTARILKQDDD